MLAFDIETLGLIHEKPLPEITCVCMCDSTGKNHCFQIWKHPDRSSNEAAILDLLDAAETLCGYNAVLFDLEYIRIGFQHHVISEERMAAWVGKCIDPYMCARYLSDTGCKMQHMLELNGLESKTGSGADAIVMARAGQWEELMAYCLMDAQLTLQLCGKEWIYLTTFLQVHLNDAKTPPVFRFIEYA
jgi:hypothetical protein